MSREHNNPEYQRNRRLILEGNPPCTYCGKENADTVDHIIELDRGGGHELENLTPCCAQCNNNKGHRYVSARNAHRRQSRHEGMRDAGITNIPKAFFYTEKIETPTQLNSLSHDPNWRELAETNHDLPRLETMSPDAAGTWLDDIRDFAREALDVELMPWQLHVAGKIFAHKENGDLVHRNALVSTARQNGKTVLLSCVIGTWLTKIAARRGKKQNVLSTANRLDLAISLFDVLAPILEVRYGAKVTKAYGRNRVVMPDGSTWDIRAAKPSTGHGTSNDLIVADEIWDINPIVIDGGLIPSQRAKHSPLMLMVSTAGDESSRAMLRWREQGLRAIDKGEPSTFYFAEWSPPPELDPLTEVAWSWGNPALGHTLEMETIRAESENPDRSQFLRASCNLWVASDRGWLPPGLWPALQHDGPIPDGGVVGIETSIDDARYFALRVATLPDKKLVATVAFVVDSYQAMLDEVDKLAAQGCKFAISPSIDIQWPQRHEHCKVIVGYGEILKFTPAVRSLIMEKVLRHDGSQQLAEHVQRAVLVKSQGSVAVSSQRSPGPIELCRTMIWAAALATRSTMGKPALGFSSV